MALTKATYAMIEGAPNNPLDFGAIGDGVADDTAALNAWLAAGGGYLPRGTYKITSSITLSNNCVIRGEGRGKSIITSSSTTASAIVGSDNCSNYLLQDFTVTRSVTPTGTAHGIEIGKNAFGQLINVLSTNHHHGFYFGPTSRSRCDECESSYNYGTGFYFKSTADVPFMQWYLIRPVSQLNDGYGFYFYATYKGSTPTYVTGPTIINSGTFANTNGGYYWAGDANSYWTDMVFDDCFSSSDGNLGFEITNLGANNQFSNVFSELAGQSLTGRTFTTPKTDTGPGFLISGAYSTESSIILSGILFKNSYQGFAIEDNVNPTTVQLNSLQAIDNSFNSADTWDGVFIGTNATTKITISNLVSKNVTTSNQRWGFNTDVTTAGQIYWVGGDCTPNVTGSVFPTSVDFGAFLGVAV
jgi:hypothetical protein